MLEFVYTLTDLRQALKLSVPKPSNCVGQLRIDGGTLFGQRLESCLPALEASGL